MDDLQKTLFWHHLPGATNRILVALLEQCGRFPDPRDLTYLHDIPSSLRVKLESALATRDARLDQSAARSHGWLQEHNATCLTLADPDYPDLLRRIPDPPAVLYLLGDPSALHMPQIALVGSRNCSRGGRIDARLFSAALARGGLGITSGLALGIDAEAHAAALDVGGLSIGIIGSGLDQLYPARNLALARRMVESGGAVVSEHPPGTPAIPHHFPRRNRIISGCALGVLVIEASERSGSLITARLALEQGREVFALPGSIHDARKTGCHRLIREGATLVTGLEDLLPELASLLGERWQALELSRQGRGGSGAISEELDVDLQNLLEHIEFEPVSFDALQPRSGLDVATLHARLTDLELGGWIERIGGSYQKLREPSDSR